MFDFDANPDYPEQVSVRMDDRVLVSEDCGDGWSKVTTRDNRLGVVPTSYIGNIIDERKGQVFAQRVRQRVDLLRSMAISWVKSKSVAMLMAVWTFLVGLFFRFVVPTAKHVYSVFITKNENVQTITSFVVRSVSAPVLFFAVPMLADEELAELKRELQDDVDLLRSERARRSGNEKPTSRGGQRRPVSDAVSAASSRARTSHADSSGEL